MERFRLEFFPAAGWDLLALLVLFSPLIQGGTPRLPTAVLQVAILLLTVVWACGWAWRSPVQAQRLTLLDPLLGFFLFSALFAVLFAPYQHSAVKALLALACYALLYWWLSFHPSRIGYRRVITALWILGLFEAAVVWYQWLNLGLERPPGTFYNPNFMASALVVAILLGPAPLLVFAQSGERGGMKRALFAAAGGAVMLAAVIMSGSRGALFALLAGGVVLLAGRSLKCALAGAAAVMTALAVIPNPLTGRISGLGSSDVYAYSRLSIWKSALQMWADHFWLGVGLGQYKFFSPRYAFPVESHWAKYGRIAENPHSEYLLAGAEMGLPGMAAVVIAILALAVWTFRRIRTSRREEKAVVVPLAAGMTALLAHSAVDFPLHVPSMALLLIFMAASLRLFGVQGPSVLLEFRFRWLYGIFAAAVSLLLMVLAVRPVVGFWYFLGGIGAPQDLFREKWALEEAPRKPPDPSESISLLERAIDFDPGNATYHNALGSQYFQEYLRGSEEGRLREKALFHANFASQLNPNNHRYHISLAQAMESLSRRLGKPELLAAAAAHYRQALALAPCDYSIHEKLAVLMEIKGDLAEAERLFREIVRLEPNYVGGWYNLAVFLARKGSMDEARAAAQMGMQAADARHGEEAGTPYEQGLVDFDKELLSRWIRQAENGTARDPR